ncbi:ketopantoate reductase family protein [Bordetella muralis]|jgi:2-dehydropantoate 2-reductase|uniref:ketopantoate reductase family protein n=1 Tax=Bordetella muralis TaxID=1649130 RepID=UPI0039F0BC98
MKICVFGAGAVGSNVAVRLASAGVGEVSIVARGPHLAAIRSHGLSLRHIDGEQWHAHFDHATDDPATLPPQDIVLVALKAASVPAQADALRQLLTPDGVVAFLSNGIPWWWNYGWNKGDGALPLLDPDGALWNRLGPERALGTVIYSANEVEAPGRALHRGVNRYIFGEPDGRLPGRAGRLAELFSSAGLGGETTADIRYEIWRKLLRNAVGSPFCALTRLASAHCSQIPGLPDIQRGLALEVANIARTLGSPITDEHALGAVNTQLASNGRPSMLQDVLLGRRIEAEALLGQPQQFARELGIASPYLDTVVGLLRGLDQALALGVQK